MSETARVNGLDRMIATSRGGARGGAAAVDTVTDVVLVLDPGSSRYTLACIRRGGPR